MRWPTRRPNASVQARSVSFAKKKFQLTRLELVAGFVLGRLLVEQCLESHHDAVTTR